MDSLNKRINFLNEVISALGLQEVTAVHGRAEEMAANTAHRQQYDLCVSRAVSNLAVLTEYCLPFVKKGGLFVSYKSADSDTEIQAVIEEKTDVIATGDSLSFVIMGCQMESKYYDKIVGVTPTDLYELAKAPGRRKNMLKSLIELPIIGTFIYNMEVSKNRIIDAFVNNYYYKGHMVSEKTIQTYYQAAHIGDGGGKYLLASIKSYYTNINVVSAIKKINNSICLIGGKEHPFIEDVINDYQEFNPAIEDAYIANTTCLPQMEAPDKFVHLVNIILHS